MNGSSVIVGLVLLALGFALGWLARANRGGASPDAGLLTSALTGLGGDMAQQSAAAIRRDVGSLVAPLEQTLDAVARELSSSERNRAAAFAGLREQMSTVARTNDALRLETTSLASAMKSSQLRGRWGELQLQRVVELAGMSKHCDFSTQVTGTTPDGDVRPDLVVHLAGNRDLIVDAKAPLGSYLEALAVPEAHRRDYLKAHARAFRNHVATLAGKRYWDTALNTPELVIMFVPADAFLDAALTQDTELLDFAFGKNVVIATPSTLIAVLKSVALSWQQHALTDDARRIHALGKELAERIGTVHAHLTTLSGALTKTVDAFNATVGSLDARVFVTARRLGELESLPAPHLAGVENIGVAPRAVSNS